MQTFLRTLTLSLSRPAYYKAVLQAPLSFSVKYYLVLAALLIVLNTVIGVINYAPAVKRDLALTAQESVQDFPPDLVVTISPAGITATKAFPLIAQMPSALTRTAAQPKNLVVIDPAGEIGALEKYQALMLVNNSYVIVGNGDSVQTSPLKGFPEITVDAAKMQQLAQTLLVGAQHAYLLTTGYFVVTGLGTFFISRLVYLAVFGLGLWLVFKSAVGTYAKAVQVSLHTVTSPLLLSSALGIAESVGQTTLHPFPGWFLATHVIFTLYSLTRLEKQPQS
jgi:type IV secretory pathway TrbD component